MKVSRNFDLVDFRMEQDPESLVVSGKRGGKWYHFNAKEYKEAIDRLSYGLLQLGFEKGDKAAIISFNRPEWNLADFAVSQLGGVTVPMYPTASKEDFAYILQDAEVKVVFVESHEFAEKLMAVKSEVPSLSHFFSFESTEGCRPLSELMDLGERNPAPGIVQGRKDSVKPEDLLTLIYTSGTTGRPKGVMLSHNNILSNVNSSAEVFPMFRNKTVLSFLPLCHIFERMVGYLYHRLEASIYYAESMDTIADNLKEVQPYAFTTVPRLLEKVYDKIVAKGNDLTGIKKKLFFWALKLGHKYEFEGANGWWYEKKLALADKLIFSKWRDALGGKVEVIVSGAAALQPRLARVFTSAGIAVLEGYGLTETSPVIAVNRFEQSNRMFGSVGPILDGVEVKIADDGEILCKGPNVMMGYFKNPEATREVLDEEGWLHTGDVGEIRKERFLCITDRKKEIFKTSGGKYVAPQAMENKFKESVFIEQVMVLGEGRKHPAALIVPSWESLQKWLADHELKAQSLADAVALPEVNKLLEEEVQRLNQSFGQWEQVKKFKLLPQEWTIDGGELTPTLKLKRKPILARYHGEIEALYDEA